ncbi:hypothetical protein NADFUDRAFT_81592, partial [Nadsonia fulvescens var. elongata DSM 6958]
MRGLSSKTKTESYGSDDSEEEGESGLQKINMGIEQEIDGELSGYFPIRVKRSEKNKNDLLKEQLESLRLESKDTATENIAKDAISKDIKVKKEPTDEDDAVEDDEEPIRVATSVFVPKNLNSFMTEESLLEQKRAQLDYMAIANEFRFSTTQSIPKTEVKDEATTTVHSSASPEAETSPSTALTSSELVSSSVQIDSNITPEIEKKLFLFQFPPILPNFHQLSLKVDDDEMITENERISKQRQQNNINSITSIQKQFPEGMVGKLRLHKSGKLTMNLGSISMDVGQGTECDFLQDV